MWLLAERLRSLGNHVNTMRPDNVLQIESLCKPSGNGDKGTEQHLNSFQEDIFTTYLLFVYSVILKGRDIKLIPNGRQVNVANVEF